MQNARWTPFPLLLCLAASAGCNAWQDDEARPADRVGRSEAALQGPAGERVPLAEASEGITARACAEVYRAEGETARVGCTMKWRDLAAQAVDEDDEDDESAMAREVCRAQGVLGERMADCQDAAVLYLRADKRGFSLADWWVASRFASACSPAAMCLEG